MDILNRRTGFASERERVEHLFALYEKMRSPLGGEGAGEEKTETKAVKPTWAYFRWIIERRHSQNIDTRLKRDNIETLAAVWRILIWRRAMARDIIQVFAEWDSEARVWVAESEDVPGLVAEASTPEELEEKLKTLIPELLELNAHLLDGGAPPRQAKTHFSAFEREVQFA